MLGTPSWSFTRGQKVYGALSGLGDSQVKIAGSILPVFNIPIIKDRTAQGIDSAADEVSSFQQAKASP